MLSGVRTWQTRNNFSNVTLFFDFSSFFFLADLDQVVRGEQNILVVGLFRLLAQNLDGTDEPHRLGHSGQPRDLVGDAEHTHAQHLDSTNTSKEA